MIKKSFKTSRHSVVATVINIRAVSERCTTVLHTFLAHKDIDIHSPSARPTDISCARQCPGLTDNKVALQ